MIETKPSLDDVWKMLDGIPDPEIPVISLVDLGVIRDVSWRGETLVVAVTPTYSGCPATAVINFEIEKTLRDNGIETFELQRQLSPPWTTDWMSAGAHEKLRRYGIAPPLGKACGEPGAGNRTSPACPLCASTQTRQVSRFGSTPCKASYVCEDCKEPFEYFKCF